MDQACVRLRRRRAGRAAPRLSNSAGPLVVLGRVVGSAGIDHLLFLGPKLEIHLHRFLSCLRRWKRRICPGRGDQLHAPKRMFFLALAGILIVLIVLDRAVARSAQNSVPRSLMARARESAGAKAVALGNSLIGVGFVEPAFDAGMGLGDGDGAINFAMSGSSALEQLLMLRYALRQGLRPRVVVFGFFDFQLTHPLEYTTGDLIGNRAMLYYLEPEYARGFYHLSVHDRIEFEIMRHFEVFAERGLVWGRVERFRRALDQQGMPPVEANAMGRSIDFAMLEYPSAPAFVAECGRASRNPLIPSVVEIARQASAAGSKVYFVEMPMPPAHVETFYDEPAWNGYRTHLKNMLGELGGTYIDASHWMPKEASFIDPLHLGWEGSREFSKRLGEYLRNAGG